MNIKNEKGMTLVEVIATVAILAAIMIPISLVFSTTYNNFITESDKSKAQESARTVLYGKALGLSNGVIGDLQRCNGDESKIKIDLLDAKNVGRSIAITGEDGKTRRYSFLSGTLYYEPDVTDLSVFNPDPDDIYLNEKSSNNKPVKVIDFCVEKKKKGTYDSNTNILINNDLINVSIKVECGRSGEVLFESSYRIPINK